MGGEDYTVFGLSGVGDTFGTCFGPLSRNRMVGLRLGRGESLDEILGSSSEVAEGVATSRAIAQLLARKARATLAAAAAAAAAAATHADHRPSAAAAPRRLADDPALSGRGAGAACRNARP